MIELSFHDSQIVKYAKNHFENKYGRTDKENLKILIGHRNGVDPQWISDKDMAIVLCQIMEELKIPVCSKFLIDTIFGNWTSPPSQSALEHFIDNWTYEVMSLPVRNGDEILIRLHPVDQTLLEVRSNDV